MEQHELPLPADTRPYKQLLKPKKTINIAVSGPVLITEIEREIIDTPEFQRLRRVRQLGLAHLVYPTALHTRFDHSLGTLHMADQMMRAIIENAHSEEKENKIKPDQKVLIRLYALLHDITHIPFGHSIEDELKLLARHDENASRITNFLGTDSSIGGIVKRRFDEGFRRRLMQIFMWDGKPNGSASNISPDDVFIHDLVSNTVCADLLDYLKRDSFFCNLGISHEYHFMKFLYLRRDEHNQLRLFVRLWKDDVNGVGGRPRREILTDLCRLLEARYLIAERVYFHHAKIIAGAMLCRAIQEAKVTEDIMQRASDDLLIDDLCKNENRIASGLATDVLQRKLFRIEDTFGTEHIHKAQRESYSTNQEAVLSKIKEPGDRLNFENCVARIIGAKPGDVLIYAPATREMNRKEAEMNVIWKGRPMKFRDIDDVVVAPRLKATLMAHELLWSVRLIMRRGSRPNEQQRQFAKTFCEVELFTNESERAKKRQDLITHIVEARLEKNASQIRQTERQRRKNVQNIVDNVLKGLDDKAKDFYVRLASGIDKQFPVSKT